MNMISTGSFLTETGASNKQSELVKKLTAAWEKKNSKSARAGGASLMALSLAACGGEDNTPFSQADVDAAKAEGVASVDITSDNTDVMLSQADYDAAIETAKTSNDADIAAAAKTEALTSADGTIYADVDAAYTAGSNLSNADAVAVALTSADGTVHTSVDAAITSNDASIEADATASAEASLLSGTGFGSVDALYAAYQTATAPTGAVARALSTSTDIVTDLTTANDTITGAFGTVQSGDVIVDTSNTDEDTATLIIGDDINVTVSNVEEVTFDIRDTNTDSDVLVDKVTGADNIVIKSSYGTTNVEVEKIGAGQKVTFADTDFTTVSVNSGGTSDSATNNVHVVLDGAYTITSFKTQETNNDVDGLTIETKTGASTVTLTAADDFTASTAAGSLDTEFVTATGDQNLTLKWDGQDADNGLNGSTVNDQMSGDATLTVTMTSGGSGAILEDSKTYDFSKMTADTFKIEGVADTDTAFKAASGAHFTNNVAQTADFALTTTAEDSSVTITSTADIAGLTIGNYDVVNIAGDTADATAENLNDIVLTNSDIGDTITLNITTGTATTVGAVSSVNTLKEINVTGDGAFVSDKMTATNINLSAKSITAQELTGTVNASTTTGALQLADVLTGAATLTSTSGKITVEEISSAAKAIVINMNDQAGVAEDATNDAAVVAGTVTLNGAGTFVTDDDITADTVTINDAVKLDSATDSNTITGDVVSNSSKAQSLHIVTGDVTVNGAGGVTVASATGADGTSFTGGAGNDSVTAAAGDAGASWVLSGGDGNDTLDIGAETTQAGSLNGGAGIDTLQGGEAVTDVLTGGSGTDTFEWEDITHGGTLASSDQVTDFETSSAGDVISLLDGTDATSDGATVVKVDTSDVGTTNADKTDIILATGTGYATEAALISALGGASGLAVASANDLKSGDVLVVWYNTTNSDVELSILNEGGVDDTLDTAISFASLTNLGLADIADFTADNFVIA